MHLVEPIYPNNPHHPQQKYRLTEMGKMMMNLWNEENKDKEIEQ